MATVVKCNRCGLDSGLGWAISRRTGKHYLVYLKDDGTPHPGYLHRCDQAAGTANTREQAILEAAQYQADRAAARVASLQTAASSASAAVPSGKVPAGKSGKTAKVKATAAEPVKPEVQSVPIGSEPGPLESSVMTDAVIISVALAAFPGLAAMPREVQLAAGRALAK